MDDTMYLLKLIFLAQRIKFVYSVQIICFFRSFHTMLQDKHFSRLDFDCCSRYKASTSSVKHNEYKPYGKIKTIA